MIYGNSRKLSVPIMYDYAAASGTAATSAAATVAAVGAMQATTAEGAATAVYSCDTSSYNSK